MYTFYKYPAMKFLKVGDEILIDLRQCILLEKIVFWSFLCFNIYIYVYIKYIEIFLLKVDKCTKFICTPTMYS